MKINEVTGRNSVLSNQNGFNFTKIKLSKCEHVKCSGFNFQQLNEILASVTFEVNAMAFTEARISNINFPSLISMWIKYQTWNKYCS